MFVIVGRSEPLYELDMDAAGGSLDEFIIHSALDMVETAMQQHTSLFLRAVDSFGDKLVSAYVTPSHVKFMLLHERGKNEEAIKAFFGEVQELFVKLALNPFYTHDTAIRSKAFDDRVHSLAMKYLS